MENTSSLQLLKQRMLKYYKNVKEEMVHKIDRWIEKGLYVVDELYEEELSKLIRQRKHG